MSEEEIVEIVFSRSERKGEEAGKIFDIGTMRGIEKSRIFNVEEIPNWFKKLKVKEIELYIETSIKSGNIVDIFVSAEGKGGVKVTLIPKNTG